MHILTNVFTVIGAMWAGWMAMELALYVLGRIVAYYAKKLFDHNYGRRK
jgi:hypothetical protein